jgi:aspartyl-tRNA(Asn)/glutamyl-tRNA(Gln) amidotransferase subunit C
MSKITPEEVRRIAELAQIGLHEDEVEKYAAELDAIMDFVEQLQKVDVEGVPPTDQVTGLVDVWRPDEVKPGLTHDDIKLNAPDFADGQFKVKRVIE